MIALTLRMVAAVLAVAAMVVPAEAAFRGDKGRIAFSRDGDLYSMLPDGTDLQRHTIGPEQDQWPRWSPDGAHLAFVRDGDLFVLWSVTTAPNLAQFTGHGAIIGAPSWHPSGTTIAYARQGLGIWSATLDTSDLTELIAGPYVTPAWSPRGDWIAFSNGASLFRSNLVDAPVRLTIDPSHRDDQPAWCPDGNRILYRATDTATSEPFIAFVYPFQPVAGGGFTGGGVANGSEPACRPDAIPDAVVNTQPDMVITRPNIHGGSDILIGPLPNGATGSAGWFRILEGGTTELNGQADWQPKLAWDVRVLEAADHSQAIVRVTIPASLPRPLVLSWSMQTAEASAPDDFIDSTGSVTVGPGETEALIPVTIVGDSDPEPDEAFDVIVAFPGFDAVSRVTIIDDDPRSQGPIAADVAPDQSGSDQSALYSHPDSLAPSVPIQLPSEQVAFSPDGSRIAFRSNEVVGVYNIWVADTLRPFGTATRITSMDSGSAAGKPAWSPDGESIAFVVDGTIWLMNADGSNQRSLVEGDNPTWSPDGLRLAFNRGVGSLDCPACTSTLHVIGVDGSNEQKLLGFPGSPSDPWAHQAFPSWDPDWSPDGRYLIYTGQFFISPDAGFSSPRIMLLDLESPILDSMNPQPLVDQQGPGSGLCQAPAWSPDGEQIVYSCRNTNPPDAQTPIDTLWVVDRDGMSPAATHLGGVSSDWGSWPSNLQPAVMLDRPNATAITETDSDAALTVPVTLSFFNGGAAPGPIDVTWRIQPGTATENVDYSPSSGVLSFRPGETSVPLSLTIHGDDESEPNESFLICFVADPNASSCQWSTQVTIRDDDSGNRPPVTASDIAATAIDTAVTIDVVANDTDPDGTPLTLLSAGTPAHGTATLTAGQVTYTPHTGFEGVDHFLYTVSDGVNTAQGAVSVSVGDDQPAPPPNRLTVTPPFLDFGVVPLNKIRDLFVTITNNTGGPVGFLPNWRITQEHPFPFDVRLEGCPGVPILNPGDSCSRPVRFWGGAGAGAASPASVTIISSENFQPVATIPLFASLGPTDTGANTPPVPADDFSFLATDFDHILDPLRNDTDPEHDLLRLAAISDPAHGTVRIIPCAPLHRMTPFSDCVEYAPDPGFVGLDSIPYTVSDGRGGEASATYYVSVGNPVPMVSSITPNQGPTAGGQAVRITGANFFRFGTNAAFVCASGTFNLTITSVAENELLATTPAVMTAGVCDVRVRVLAGQPGVLANAYLYETSTPTQSITPANAAPPTAPVVPINTGPHDQIDPHVSKDLMAYTDNAATGPMIRFFDFSTGVDALVPTAFGNQDQLSEVNEGRITFSRLHPNNQSELLMFVPATGITHTVGAAGTGQYWSSAIGNNTVAVIEETATFDNQLVTISLATGLRETLPTSSRFDLNPNVSPDGNTVVWQACDQGFIECDVLKAVGGPGSWLVAPVTTTFNNANPDTDGTWIVYDSNRAGAIGGADIYFQPIGGGVETQLTIPGIQRNPSISRGVIAFETINPGQFSADLYVYDIATNLLYRVTSTPNVNETLNDISVLDNGDVRVVWAANDGEFQDFNVYAKTFSLVQPADTTPPVAVLDVAPHLVAGQALTLSGARSIDVGGAVTRYRWEIPDAGVDVETTTPTYALPAPTGLSEGPHVVTLTVTDSSGNVSLPVSATVTVIAQQHVVPAFQGLSPGAIQAISSGSGDQNDPHVHKNLMAYTDNAGSTSVIQWFNFASGTSLAIPQSSGEIDLLADVNQNRISFSRVKADRTAVELFESANVSSIEINPGAGVNRLGTALGGDTLAYVDLLSGNRDVVLYDVSTGTTALVGGSPDADYNPSVSPDGTVVVWVRDAGSSDIYKALRVQGTWHLSPVAATSAPEGNPDTDGTWIVYDRQLTNGSAVLFRQISGGPEFGIGGFVEQDNPAISDGVISFRGRRTATDPIDLFVYEIASNRLYQVTSDADIQGLSDISMLDNGDARVVWAAAPDTVSFPISRVYATTFSLLSRPTLTVSPASGVPGQSITLSASLTLDGSPVDDALLEFHVTGDPAVAFDRTDANGVASVSGVFGVNPGTYPNGIVVNFPGDPARRLGTATGTGSLTISRASSSLALIAAPNPVAVGDALTATAVVASAFGMPAGDVAFSLSDGTTVTPLGAAPLVNGTATFAHSGLAVGEHVICGEYAGSAIHEGSLDCERVTVVRASSQVNLSSSRNPSITTGPPVFIATINTTATVQPTGKVEFFADGTLLCRSTVYSLGGVRTQASCGGAPLTVGTHTITATYTGDANFDSSSAAALTQTVQPGGYLALDLGFQGEAVALSPNGWVTGNSVVKSALSTSTDVTAYVHNGTTLGMPVPIPSLGGPKTTAVGVDDTGRVGGSSTTATGDTHVFLFDGTTTHDHHNPTFGGLNSRAMAMNSSGVMVGIADTATGFRAFVDLRAGAFDLGTIAGGSNSAAFAISEPVFGSIGLGHIAGVSTVPGGAGHAALFGGATATDLGTLGGLASGATAVNRAGESAGFSDVLDGGRHAFIHRDGVMLDIGNSLGSALSLATAMNDAGEVVGTYEDSSSSPPASRTFLYSLNTTTDLGLGTFATINNSGVVVSNVSNRIAIRTGGSVLLLGSGSGGTLPSQGPMFNASVINDEGRIAGFIRAANGQPRATVWIPVPLASLVADAAAAPAGATVTLAATLTSQGAPVANKTIRFSIEDVDAGTAVTDASGRATLSAALPALAAGVYPEGIRALFTGDETLGAAVATAPLTVQTASADLSLGATVSPGTVDAGATVRYTVTVTNNGPSPASDVSINVTGPASLLFGTTNSLCLRTPLINSLDCSVLTPIAAGGQYVLTVDARPTAAGTVSATFTVSSSSDDPSSANNQAVVGVNVNPATDLSIAVVPSRTLVAVGESLNYTVSVRNNGQIIAPAARVSITADPGYTIDQTTLPGLSCIIAGGTWTCVVGNIGPGATAQFSVIGRVAGSGPGTNTFSVASGLPDPILANNTAALAFDARPTVTIDQAAGQSDPATSAPVNFTVVFSEPVTGFGNADVSFAGSSVGGTLTATVTGSGANYNVAVNGMVGVGQVAVSIPAGAAIDTGGNPNAASTSTDSTVLFGVATVVAMVSPSNGGNAALTVLRFGNSLTGILFYSRSGTILTATRFTSLVIDGQTATLEGFSTNNRFFLVKARDGGSDQPDTFRLWIDGVEQTAATGAIATGTVLVSPWGPDTRLRGWVDLHTHPMSNLAFGGKLFHGAPSVNSLMPAMQMPNDPECRFDQRATSIAEALSQDGPTRGNPLQSRCGDFARQAVIGALELFNGASIASIGSGGYPAFTSWPRWDDITHQKMWIDWIRRAWEGGQRVMVALSHNNRTLAGMLGAGGPISGVRDDRASSDLQIEEIKRLVGENADFMGIARTPDELRAIVEDGRLAVVLGVELDKIGNFGTAPTEQAIDDEIARLHAQGVRYILPLHFVDNAFGDTAIHQSLFNVLNFRENGSFFTVGCANVADEIGFQLAAVPVILNPLLLPGMPMPPVAPLCIAGGRFFGHVNTRRANGLTAPGEFAIRAMMRRGMIVDIDHMSNRAANRTLAIASGVPGGGYPLTSGHTAVRDRATSQFNAENSRSTTQLARIACLGGMFGLGTDGAGAHRWAQHYERGYNVMRRAFAPNGLCPNTLPLGAGFVGLGTDTNSLVKMPVPPMLDPAGPPRFADIYNASHPLNAGVPPLAMSTTGTKTWDYNVDGVAHYGMFVDFLRDVRMFTQPGAMPGREIVDDQMMYGADYFYRMWLKADTQKTRVP